MLAVTVVPAEIRPLVRSVIGDGSVVPWQELIVSAETAGLRVAELAADEGDQVRRGQVLARFDDSFPVAQLAQAEAAVTEADALRQSAGADFNRATELSRGTFIAPQTVEQRQAAARQAEARYLAARAHRDEAAARLAQTRVLAPADGLVLRRSVQLGAVAAAGQEMFRLLRENRLEVEAKVPELDLAAVHPGQSVEVVHGTQRVAATVRAVAPVVATDTRLAVVHVALHAGSGLRPGMFARAVIQTDRAADLVVPQAALVVRNGQPAVFIVQDGDRVALRHVRTGLRQDALVELIEGLYVGDRVVTSGAGFLSDGDHVRVVAPLAVAAN